MKTEQKIEQLEEKIINGENIFVIYSDDLEQLYIDLENLDKDDFLKCVPHLSINNYGTPCRKRFPILVKYNDENSFEIILTGHKLNVLYNGKVNFLNTIPIDYLLDYDTSVKYIKESLNELIENPLCVHISNIRLVDNIFTDEKETILKGDGLNEQSDTINLIIHELSDLYHSFINSLDSRIENRNNNLRERHNSYLKQKAHKEQVNNEFALFIEEMSKKDSKVLSLKKSN